MRESVSITQTVRPWRSGPVDGVGGVVDAMRGPVKAGEQSRSEL